MPSYIYISYNYLKSNLEYYSIAILQHCYNIKNQTRKKKRYYNQKENKWQTGNQGIEWNKKTSHEIAVEENENKRESYMKIHMHSRIDNRRNIHGEEAACERPVNN